MTARRQSAIDHFNRAIDNLARDVREQKRDEIKEAAHELLENHYMTTGCIEQITRLLGLIENGESI